MLKEWLSRNNMTQARFAAMVPKQQQKDISNYINGRCPTLPVAVEIEKITGIPASYWVERKANADN